MDTIQHLETFGYAIEENVIPKDECERMGNVLDELKDYHEQRNSLYKTDSQTVIFNLHLEKPDLFLDKISIPKVIHNLKNIFKEDFILSNFNASLSGKHGGDRTHIDSRIPITNFHSTFQVAVMLCIDDFTSQNGGTIVWPFSHKTDNDPKFLKEKMTFPGAVHVNAPKGSVIYTLGQTWHDVGPNLDQSRRWGIIAYYTSWWVKPTFDFTKCGSNIYSKLTPEQKILLGFTSRPPIHGEQRHHTVVKVEELPEKYDEL